MINFLKRLYFSYQMEKLYRSLKKKGAIDMDCEYNVMFYHYTEGDGGILRQIYLGEEQEAIMEQAIIYGDDHVYKQELSNVYVSERKMKDYVIEDLLAARYMWDLF